MRLLALTLPLAAIAGSICLNSGGTDGSQICFSWSTDAAAGTVTINAECTPPNFPPPVVGPVTWCAIGLNKPGNTNKMFQSNIWVFGPLPGATDDSAFVGDHLSMAYAQPPCLPNQLSKVGGPVVKGASNAINVTFSRPLTVPAPGVSIVPGAAYSIIGAMSTYNITEKGPFCPPPGAPKPTFPVHPVQYANGQTVTFL